MMTRIMMVNAGSNANTDIDDTIMHYPHHPSPTINFTFMTFISILILPSTVVYCRSSSAIVALLVRLVPQVPFSTMDNGS